MKMNFYSIYDSATEAYMRPWTAVADGQAVRLFEDEVRGKESPISNHPHDYSLFRLGSFDDHNGEIKVEVLQCLRRGHEVPLGDVSFPEFVKNA